MRGIRRGCAAIATRPGSVLTLGGRAVLAHLPEAYPAGPMVDAMTAKSPWAGTDLDVLEAETAQFSYHKLRKRDRPFVLPLDAADPEPVERAAYNAAYKGVTDALTLYLWRRPAFYLTRWAASAGLTPNMVTAVGAIFCLLAIYLFWIGQYWPGIAAAFTFMVLDTVDGKLARCTGTSSNWGNIFDHGIDLVHPPFWWWAWAEGLHDYGTPIEPVLSSMLLIAIICGYVAQRLIEGIFVRRFGMHIHVWRKFDSKFRLVTARRNPNMVILVVSLAVRPARSRARAGRAVDAGFADLPRGAAGAGQCPARSRPPGRVLAGVTGRMTGQHWFSPGRGPGSIRLPPATAPI